MTKDSLGDRMKSCYEAVTRFFLPRRSYTIIRVDGKAFHTYTKHLQKPFDAYFCMAMDYAAVALCEEITGALFAFTQSDEISIVVADFKRIKTCAWFDNNLQKMCSVSASTATCAFNERRLCQHILHGSFPTRESILTEFKWGKFDSRVFQIPQRTEVINYFRWRQKDTVRNSIESVAHSLYSQSELVGKNGDALQELIFQKGINWNDYTPQLKRGRITIKKVEENGHGEWQTIAAPDFFKEDGNTFFAESLPENEAIMEE